MALQDVINAKDAFSATGTSDLLPAYMEAVIGVLTDISGQIDNLDEKIDDLDEKIDALEARVEALEE